MSATSSSTEPVDMLVDILSHSNTNQWSLASPDVFALEDIPQRDRGPSQETEAHLYVWSPTGGNIDGLSGDWTTSMEQHTVEIQVWSLDRSETSTYKEDLINFLQNYANDNEANTVFHRIRASNQDDLRSQHQYMSNDHYVMTVEVTVRRLRDY